METILNESQTNIIKAFVDEWRNYSSAKSILYLTFGATKLYPKNDKGILLKTSEESLFAAADKFRGSRDIGIPGSFKIFSAVDFEGARIVDFSNELNKDEKFDLIIGALPFGMHPIDTEFQGTRLKIPRNWSEILQSLCFLNENGTALYLVEPLGFSNNVGQKFEKELNKNGFYISAYFNTPDKILQPLTSVTPVLVVITKKSPSKLFVAELLNEKQTEESVRLFFKSEEIFDFRMGKYIDIRSFRGFHRLKVEQQIDQLKTQYKNYKEYTLVDLAVEINSVGSKGEFEEKNNAIYIPKLGKSLVVSNLSETKLKLQNYYQVVLKEFASNDYVAAFFRSTLGRLILDSNVSNTFVNHLNKRDLEQLLIALPRPEEQKIIVNTQKTLSRLKSSIDEFDTELALNPASSSNIQKQLDIMLDAIGELTEVDKILSIIREGESKYAEFKETLSLDIKTQIKEKDIETSALKTIVAFLNTEGGILLIGISDDGKITGINTEIEKFHKNLDKFLLYFKNRLKERVGEHNYPFVEYRTIKVKEKIVLWVECKASPSPCYLDGRDFYVRTNPATDKLEGPKLVDYVRNHFK